MIVVTAGARIHTGYQHETGRKFHGKSGAANGDPTFFHGLAHDFEYAAFEFG